MKIKFDTKLNKDIPMYYYIIKIYIIEIHLYDFENWRTNIPKNLNYIYLKVKCLIILIGNFFLCHRTWLKFLNIFLLVAAINMIV